MRLLVSQALIIVTMGITLLGVGAVVGPAEFRQHLAQAGAVDRGMLAPPRRRSGPPASRPC